MRLSLLLVVFAFSFTLGNSAAQAQTRFRAQDATRYQLSVKVRAADKQLDVTGTMQVAAADEKVRNIAYNKGFLVWDMLSREIGRQKFQSVLRGITRRYVFRQLTLKEFWRAI